MGTFAPTFVLGFKLLPDQESAALAAGAMAATAGAIGVPLGGWFIDWGQKRAKAKIQQQSASIEAARLLGVDESVAIAEAHMPTSIFDTPVSTTLYALTREGSENASMSLSARPTSIKSTGSRPLSGGSHRSGDASASAIGGGGGLGDLHSVRGGFNTELAASALAAPPPPPPVEEEDATSEEMLDMKLNVSMPQATILAFLGTVVMIAGVFTTTVGIAPFLSVLAIGTLLLMGTTAGINLAMMAAVPAESRSFAIGMGTLMLHALGDVPAPIVIGTLADSLSPQTCDADNKNCNRSQDGLRDTLLATACWLIWPIVLWSCAWALAARRQNARRTNGYYSAARASRAASLMDSSHFPTTTYDTTPLVPLVGTGSGNNTGGGVTLQRVPASKTRGSNSKTASVSGDNNNSSTAIAIPPRRPFSNRRDVDEASAYNIGVSLSSSVPRTGILPGDDVNMADMGLELRSTSSERR